MFDFFNLAEYKKFAPLPPLVAQQELVGRVPSKLTQVLIFSLNVKQGYVPMLEPFVVECGFTGRVL